MNKGFRLPTEVILHPGALGRLSELLESRSYRRVLLVLDPGLEQTPWPEKLQSLVADSGGQLSLFTEVEANPRTATAEAVGRRARSEKAHVVVALGGGSAMDAAKAGALLATNEGSALSFLNQNRFPHDPLPLIAIPTTCGTGSEVTWVSVLTHEATQRKISLKGNQMFPDVALVDADLLTSLPAHLVAWTGMDALTHALEAVTGRLANPVSDALAEKAIFLLFQHLPAAVANIAGEPHARAQVMRASTLAGMAFGNADVGAVHCLSETLGAFYDIPHGLANAVLLAPVLNYHRPFIHERLGELYRLLPTDGPASDSFESPAHAFLDRLARLCAAVAVPPFSRLDVPPHDYDRIARAAVANGSNGSNPQPMGVGNYRIILDSL